MSAWPCAHGQKASSPWPPLENSAWRWRRCPARGDAAALRVPGQDGLRRRSHGALRGVLSPTQLVMEGLFRRSFSGAGHSGSQRAPCWRPSLLFAGQAHRGPLGGVLSVDQRVSDLRSTHVGSLLCSSVQGLSVGPASPLFSCRCRCVRGERLR